MNARTLTLSVKYLAEFYRTLVTGYWLPDIGYRILVTGYWLLGITGYWIVGIYIL